MTQRIALLVDGDNLSPAHAPRIMAEAAKLGRVDLVRVYGNAARTSDWLTTPGYRMVHAGCGKNAADVLLCIDAMELALTGGWGGFVIASSDGDFVHLAQRLRERGLEVLGIGEAKAPAMFGQACTRFVTIGTAELKGNAPSHLHSTAPDGAIVRSGTGTAVALPTQRLRDLDGCIRQMMVDHKVPAQGMALTALNARMATDFGFLISAHEDRTWRTYFGKRPTLFSVDPPSAQARVRYRMQGFAARLPVVPIAAE